MLEDVVKGFIVKNMSEKRELLLSKILCKLKQMVLFYNFNFFKRYRIWNFMSNLDIFSILFGSFTSSNFIFKKTEISFIYKYILGCPLIIWRYCKAFFGIIYSFQKIISF